MNKVCVALIFILALVFQYMLFECSLYNSAIVLACWIILTVSKYLSSVRLVIIGLLYSFCATFIFYKFYEDDIFIQRYSLSDLILAATLPFILYFLEKPFDWIIMKDKQCGVDRLNSDGDSVPCENICKK